MFMKRYLKLCFYIAYLLAGFCQNVFGQQPLDAAYMSGSEGTCVPETQMQMDTVDQFSDFHCEELNLYAKSAVLTDADTGRILYGKEANSPMANASTTKIMTCLLAIESGKTGDSVTFSEYACSMPKVRLGCSVGTQFLLEDLLYSLMLESHNDAAVILAEKTAGSVEAFAEKMNQKAEEIGCSDTHFVTPNGLDDEDAGGEHATTAVDLARILRYCIMQSPKRDEFLEITRTKTYEFSDVEQKKHYSCYNHNAFLDMMEGALTGKTGFTGKAGYCYVGALESEGRTFVVALLGCGWPNNRSYKWTDTKKLMDYAKEHFYIREFEMNAQTPQVLVEDGIPASGKIKDPCLVKTAVQSRGGQTKEHKIRLLVSDEDEVKLVCHMKTKTAAPLEADTVMGNVTLFLNNEKIKENEIVTADGAERISLSWCAGQIIKKFFIS